MKNVLRNIFSLKKQLIFFLHKKIVLKILNPSIDSLAQNVNFNNLLKKILDSQNANFYTYSKILFKNISRERDENIHLPISILKK